MVVPQFAQLYDQLGTKLPTLTLVLLSFGKWLQHNFLWLLLIAIVSPPHSLPLLPHRARPGLYRRRPRRLPLFGKIWLKYQVALFARTLSTLLTGGLPLVPSLETAARAISSRRVSKAVFSSVGTVREGKSLAESLENTGVFPALATEMITVGEQTGALPQMLNSVAEFFEEDVATALGRGPGPDRTRDPHRHGRRRRLHSDLAVSAHLLAGPGQRDLGGDPPMADPNVIHFQAPPSP